MASTQDFVSLVRQDGDPTSIDDWLYSDRPLLGLHIVSFSNATLVSFSWSYVALDGSESSSLLHPCVLTGVKTNSLAVGHKALYDACSLVLHGREQEVPPFYGFTTDPLTTLGTNPREEYKQVEKQISTWQLLVLGARLFFSKLWNPPPPDETRVVLIPASFAQHLRDTAMADISDPTRSQQQQPLPAVVSGAEDYKQSYTDISAKPFVSEGDVICAW